MEEVDVVVVGGGPAGSSAGRAAAARGADTVVLEKGVPRADREGVGPDSTDAAGMLDYWLDLMELDPSELPDGVILQELDGADFYGPREHLALDSTGISASYDRFGFTFNRARFDDFLRSEAEAAGASYRTGTGVRDVTSDLSGGEHRHEVTLADGTTIAGEYLVLADGPQRQVTIPVLDEYLPNRTAGTRLAPPSANHIAYQEHRRFPEELFDEHRLKFWWGWIPGETAYPWVFPNDGTVARVGLTMPIGMDIENFEKADYRLLREGDDRIPDGGTYIRRLLEELYGDDYDIETDFPLVQDRGKRDGTETYPISSTRPIESPVAAGIAVTGGAMGATSAFHEGGDHTAVATGQLAGRLAASGQLDRYNAAWQAQVGNEILRSVVFADLVESYQPADWDDAFRTASRLRNPGRLTPTLSAGLSGLSLVARYRLRKLRLRRRGYTQIRTEEYRLPG
ncbi:MAG: NAD(P)/FAD-dependent oxidoreductase [Halobacteriaceae archaeon]